MTVLVWGGIVVACGGAVGLPDGDGGGGGDGTTGDGSGGCSNSPPSCLCGNAVCRNGQWGCTACAPDCVSLATKLAAERAKLQTCCPTCKAIQCMGVAQDVCCAITTGGGDATAFQALVTEYKAQCPSTCPGAPCPMVPSGICDPSQSDPNSGRCR